MIQHSVIKHQVALLTPDHLSAHGLPHHPRGELFILQIALHRIVAKAGMVVREGRQRVVRLAHQQKLTIIQSGDFTHACGLSDGAYFGSFA